MKKWFAILLSVVILLIVSVYIFIPGTLIISSVSMINCNTNAAERILSDTAAWKKWWPSEKKGSEFFYKNYSFSISQILPNIIGITIKKNHSSIPSTLLKLPVGKDSTAMQWQCNLFAGNNPAKRFLKYQEAVELKRSMSDILKHLQEFLQVPENIYGITIKETSTTDTLLIATKKTLSHFPSTEDVYGLINQLKNYIKTQNADVAGNPMINVTALNKNQFEVMAAIPTNKQLKTEGEFLYRRMIPGNFLTTVVKGGDSSIAQAQQQMKFFMDDYQKTPMAIMFQSLITDRSMEKDTSKWITKLYFPVMK